MNMMKQIFLVFLYILAGSLIGSTLFITFYAADTPIGVLFLWQLILLSVLCAVATLIFYSNHELSKRQYLIRNVVHYIAIHIIMLTGAVYFQWINSNQLWDIVIFILIITLVYVIVNVAVFISNKTLAKQLNEQLLKIQIQDED